MCTLLSVPRLVSVVTKIAHCSRLRVKPRMITHGNIGEFNRVKEDWVFYCERMQQHFTANYIATDDKKKAILLSNCGAETYQLIQSRVALQKPMEKSLSDIIQLVRDHHTPPPSAIEQRFRFHSRTQRRKEKLSLNSLPTSKNSANIANSSTHSMICFVIASFASSGMHAYNDVSWQSRI